MSKNRIWQLNSDGNWTNFYSTSNAAITYLPRPDDGDEPLCRRWRLAAEALSALVREDYPSDLRLSEIAQTWGTGLTPDHIEALRLVEPDLPTEVGLRFREDSPDRKAQ